MANNTNYTDRKTDLLVFQNWAASGQTLVDVDFNEGYIVAGIMKLIQQFAIRFLTQRGSSAKDTSYGTDFMTELRDGYMRTDADVKSAFSAANEEIKAQLRTVYDARELLNEVIPDDEKFSNATLDSFTISPGSISLLVTIESQSGESRDVVLPITSAIT
jgi:hypothetical protein